jgi:light-regulated signal transduction histidine kinase (bacteriophytochrome)
VLQEVLRNLNAQAEECSAAITSDPLPTVCCDATQLMQIFQNLISNAIAYRSEEPLQIHVGAEEREEDWCFSVRDNGVGIAPKYFARIFQIFQRLYAEHEHPGSGVGLSLCKRIVERHGGGIWVESTPGSGSVFYFTIPKRQTPSNAKAD